MAAFCHALRLAVCASEHPERKEHALLELFYCEPNERERTGPFPHVRERLYRWGVLGEEEQNEALIALGLAIRKHIARGEVGEEIMLEAESREFDLLVMSSEARIGWSHFLHGSVSVAAIHNTQVPGLVLPGEVQGFVDARTGQVDLERILVPVAETPDAWPALQAVARLLATLQPVRGGEVMMLHVGSDQDFPEQPLPPLPKGWVWTRKTLPGEPVPTLEGWASDWRPQLAALASGGQRSWRDRWFGSTAEHLLNRFACALLVAPSEGSPTSTR